MLTWQDYFIPSQRKQYKTGMLPPQGNNAWKLLENGKKHPREVNHAKERKHEEEGSQFKHSMTPKTEAKVNIWNLENFTQSARSAATRSQPTMETTQGFTKQGFKTLMIVFN